MHSILGSIKSMLVPVRPEGIPFLAVALFLSVFVGWFWAPIFWAGLLVSGWIAYFFRDPRRVTPLDPGLVFSPADGRITSVSLGVAPKELGLGEQRRRRVSVFMGVFDCHVNRAPLAGTVERIVYRPGRFLNAELDKASEENERNGVILKTEHGRVAVVQIAGLVARRIVCFVEEHAALAPGERFGLIRFGSRLDVYLPANARILVAEGQTAIAGETVIADFGEGPAERRVRID